MDRRIDHGFELIMRDGVRPTRVVGKEVPPPPEYTATRENGLYIECNVTVRMRDGINIFIDWPLARTEFRKLFLDATTHTLSEKPIATVGQTQYDSTSEEGRARCRSSSTLCRRTGRWRSAGCASGTENWTTCARV